MLEQKITNPLDGKREEIIEQFVKYYGEEFRNQITERINSTEVFVAYTEDTLYELSKGIEDPIKREEFVKKIKSAPKQEKFQVVYKLYGYDSVKIPEQYLNGLNNQEILAIKETVNSILRMGKSAFFEACVNNESFALTASEQLKKIGIDIQLSKIIEVFKTLPKPYKHQDSNLISFDLNQTMLFVDLESCFSNIKELRDEYKFKLIGEDSLQQLFNGGNTLQETLKLKAKIDLSNFFEDSSVGAFSNYSIKDGNLIPYITIRPNSSTGDIVHELGHVVQMSLMSNGKVKSGVRSILSPDLTALNETLNEYFTQEILKSGGHSLEVGTNETTPCLYHRAFPLIIPFMEKYKEQFKHYIMSNNPQEIIDLIGEDNLCKLNDALDKLIHHPLLENRWEKGIQKNGYEKTSSVMYEIAGFPKEESIGLPEHQQILVQCFRTGSEVLKEIEKRLKVEDSFNVE